jgi:hypothetical protein
MVASERDIATARAIMWERRPDSPGAFGRLQTDRMQGLRLDRPEPVSGHAELSGIGVAPRPRHVGQNVVGMEAAWGSSRTRNWPSSSKLS